MSTIEKALGLLEHFSGAQPEIGLSEFKGLTGVDKGTLHRHLTALRHCGFLEQNPVSKAYRLGPAVIRLANVRENTVPIVKTVSFYVDQIAADISELVHAALPQKNGMSAIYAMDGGHHGTRVSFDDAEILPFHATSSGLAMLAFSDAAFVDAVLSQHLNAFTSTTSTDLDDIRTLIAQARTGGFSYANQTYEAEVCSVAIPFFGHTENAIGTLAIATPTTRMDDAIRDGFLRRLIAASTALSRDLGGRIPPEIAALWATRLEH